MGRCVNRVGGGGPLDTHPRRQASCANGRSLGSMDEQTYNQIGITWMAGTCAIGGEMATNARAFAEVGLGELLELETSVLQTLCLTVNTAGSEIKYKILDVLTSHDFYFPVNGAIFDVLEDMHRKGDYIVHSNLDEELRRRSVDCPEGFYLEDLFNGELPPMQELEQSVSKVKERSSLGLPPRPDEAEPEAETNPRFTAAERLPAKPSATAQAPKDPKPDPSQTQVNIGARAARRTSEPDVKRDPSLANAKRAAPALDKSDPAASRVKSDAGVDTPNKRPPLAKSSPLVLASEGTELGNYLEELGSKQGKTLESGFASLDEATEGLGPGVMLVVDDEPDRLSGFLKQLTDQIAEGARVPCLYVSFRLSKDVLRVRTLARLSGVSARDIEKGRLKKDSSEWKKIETSGKQASPWMKRVFVVEAGSETNISLIRKMCRQLLESSGGAICALFVDGIESLGKNGETVASCAKGLKELSESMDVVVIAGAKGAEPLVDPSIDFAGVLREGKGGMMAFELLAAGESEPQLLSFEYLPSIHRFIDRSK